MLYLAADLNVRPKRYDRSVHLIAIIFVSTFVGTITGFSVFALAHFRPARYDPYMYRIDGLLGFQPSFLLGRLVDSSFFLRALTVESYRGLLTAITLALTIQYSQQSFWPPVRAFVLDAYLAAVFYLACPIAGPMYLFPNFPAATDSVPAMHPMLVHGAPNGMPSVHFSSALLVVYFCWHKPLGRWLAILFALMTAIATLATGEHYLVDLVAAVPYTVLILWISGALRIHRTDDLALRVIEDGAEDSARSSEWDRGSVTAIPRQL